MTIDECFDDYHASMDTAIDKCFDDIRHDLRQGIERSTKECRKWALIFWGTYGMICILSAVVVFGF